MVISPRRASRSVVTECLLAIGGNIGASPDKFELALQRLDELGVQAMRVSAPMITRPVGSNAGEGFLNAAVVVETSHSPMDLLQLLHKVEAEFGRQRTIHWGPRTMDLDLLFYGDRVIDTPEIVVPHPAMWYRRFVIDPAVEVAAGWVHPILKVSLKTLQHRLNTRPLVLEFDLGSFGCSEISAATALTYHKVLEAILQHAAGVLRDAEMDVNLVNDGAMEESSSDSYGTAESTVIGRVASPPVPIAGDSFARVIVHSEAFCGMNSTVEGIRRSQSGHSKPFQIDAWLPESRAGRSITSDQSTLAAQSLHEGDPSVEDGVLASHGETVAHLILAMLG